MSGGVGEEEGVAFAEQARTHLECFARGGPGGRDGVAHSGDKGGAGYGMRGGWERTCGRRRRGNDLGRVLAGLAWAASKSFGPRHCSRCSQIGLGRASGREHSHFLFLTVILSLIPSQGRQPAPVHISQPTPSTTVLRLPSPPP